VHSGPPLPYDRPVSRRRQAPQGPGSVSHEFSLLFELYAASNVGAALVDEALGPVADGYAVFGAVRVLGPITPGDAAALIGLPATTATDVVQRLVDRGVIERVANPRDGRSYLLQITPKGEAAWEESRAPFEPVLARLEGNLDVPPDDVRRVLRALDSALRATLEELRSPTAATG
jgi:DNA-binding MarR family transcriptional regulator